MPRFLLLLSPEHRLGARTAPAELGRRVSRALELTANERERDFLKQRLSECARRNGSVPSRN